MAPPTLVFTRQEIFKANKDKLLTTNPDCQLKSITQHECTFKISENAPPEIICLPFKRIFQRCLENVIIKDKSTGDKRVIPKWTNYEVTSLDTNQDLFSEAKYKEDVSDFFNAEKELKKLMEKELRE